MKRVLILTYCWPPDASVGAVRPAKLAHYLAQDGWQPIVVTVKERHYSAVHRKAGDVTSAAIVLRTRMLANPTAWYRSVKAWLYARLGKREEFAESVLSWSPQNAVPASHESLPARLRRTLLSLLQTPDVYQGWLPFAIAASFRAVWTHDIQCVVSTGPPFTAHLAALAVKAVCGLPWVADFRDPWLISEETPASLKSYRLDSLDRWMESTVIRAADRVVCVTPAMTEAYRIRYPRHPSEKWVTITNGFDAEEFRRLGDVPCAPKFTISYVGSLLYARSPETLLQAIADLIGEGALDRHDVAVRLIGFCRYAGGRSVGDMIAACGLSDVAEILDTIPRQDALREMMRSQVLLLLANEQQLQVPGKAYEYIGAGGHILALAESGATAELISGIEGSAVCDIKDIAGMKRILAAWYDEFKANELADRNHQAWERAAVRKYEWKELGRAYALLLEQCLSHGRRRSSRALGEWDKEAMTSDVRD